MRLPHFGFTEASRRHRRHSRDMQFNNLLLEPYPLSNEEIIGQRNRKLGAICTNENIEIRHGSVPVGSVDLMVLDSEWLWPLKPGYRIRA